MIDAIAPERPAADVVKPPKTEEFRLREGVNVDPKGIIRPVDSYREDAAGLRMARGSDHRDFGYLESLLLPAMGLRVNVFHRRPGSSYDFERYIDVADVERADGPGGPVWRTRDLYLDVVVAGGAVRVEDADELTAAVAAGLVSPADAASAIDRAWTAVRGIAAHGGDVDAWLAAEGVDAAWLDPASVTLVDEGAWA
ncbi:DUF402 domain-containing protein [Corynebacterium sp. 335C]